MHIITYHEHDIDDNTSVVYPVPHIFPTVTQANLAIISDWEKRQSDGIKLTWHNGGAFYHDAGIECDYIITEVTAVEDVR